LSLVAGVSARQPDSSLSLLGFLYVERGYFSHPACVALLASDDQAKRPFRRRQPSIAKQPRNYVANNMR
jgi:hypothetical protein